MLEYKEKTPKALATAPSDVQTAGLAMRPGSSGYTARSTGGQAADTNEIIKGLRELYAGHDLYVHLKGAEPTEVKAP